MLSILASLSDPVLEDWQLFIRSPFFKMPPKIQRLAQFLLQKRFGAGASAPGLVEIHQICYPQAEQIRPQQVYDSLSQLKSVFFQFIIHRQLRDHPTKGKVQLLEGLTDIGAGKEVHKQLNAIRTAHRGPLRDQTDALSRMLISHQATLSFAAMHVRAEDNTLEEVIRDTDQHYLLSRIKYSCERLNRRHILSVDTGEAVPAEPVLGLSAWPETSLSDPLITLYLRVWDMLTTKQQAPFYELKALLLEHSGKIGEEEAISLYAYAQNFCIQQINTGKSIFLEELFSLYQDTLAKGLLTRHGEMDHRQYKNIATVALRLSRYRWVESFLETHKHLLPVQHRENTFRINMAALHYEQQRFGESLQLLQRLEFTDVYYQLSARVLTLKIFFEQEDDESLEHHISTFRMFLQRNKDISGYQRQIHLNLVKATRKLSQIRTRSYRLHQTQIVSQISEVTEKSIQKGNMANLSWILAQAQQMKQALAPNNGAGDLPDILPTS